METQSNERDNQTEAAGIQKPYAYHQPSNDGLTRITRIRRAFSEVDSLLRASCPPSRELSTAITTLETAAMWAIKSVVINDPKSISEDQVPMSFAQGDSPQ